MTSVPTSPDTPLVAPDIVRAGRLYDPVIVFVVGVLMTIGVVMVYSASVTIRGAEFSWGDWLSGPLRQGVFAAIGFVGMLIAAHVNYRSFSPELGFWRAWTLYVLTALLLVAVLVPGIGHEAMGARRQILVPGIGFGFQPSEIAKVVMVIWLAAFIERAHAMAKAARVQNMPLRLDPRLAMAPPPRKPKAPKLGFISAFVPAVAICGALIALVIIEDFGTAALMGVVMLLLLWLGGTRLRHLSLLGILGILGGVAMVIVKPHRVERVKTYIETYFGGGEVDPQGAGYQVQQALLAIGSGGWWGRGLGNGIQKYGYLPQDNNDFILAVICEELGVVGGLVVVGLFLILLARGWWLAARAPDLFGKLLALGLTLTICLQAALNVAVVTNSVPTKGISLPFVSQGGSGVIFLGVAAGLLAAVGREEESEELA